MKDGTVGEADLRPTWPQPHSLEANTKGRKAGNVSIT